MFGSLLAKKMCDAVGGEKKQSTKGYLEPHLFPDERVDHGVLARYLALDLSREAKQSTPSSQLERLSNNNINNALCFLAPRCATCDPTVLETLVTERKSSKPPTDQIPVTII